MKKQKAECCTICDSGYWALEKGNKKAGMLINSWTQNSPCFRALRVPCSVFDNVHCISPEQHGIPSPSLNAQTNKSPICLTCS